MADRRLHIGVDAWNLLGDRRGIGRYTRAVLREWTTTFADAVDLTLLIPEWPAWWYTAAYRREAASRLRIHNRNKAAGAQIDALWFPWNGLSWTASKPKVAVLHDASLFALEMPAHKRAQELIPLRRAVSESAHLITDSDFSRRELVRHLDLAPDQIEVVPLGVDIPPQSEPSIETPLPFQAPYILFVGEFEKRKGIDVLLEAIRRLDAGLRSNTALVLVGETRGADVRSAIPTAVLGHVDDRTLSALYRGAAAFVYPSRYEGFGLPVLEAMAHGAPVVASNAGGIPEAGGEAARYFESGDADELAAALREVLRDAALAQELRIRGQRRAREMPWAATAGKTLEIIARSCKR